MLKVSDIFLAALELRHAENTVHNVLVCSKTV